MHRTASGVLTLGLILALAACPGATSDLCAGVTCAPGRTCVGGVCQTGTGCTTRGDCQGNQICVAGQCMDPAVDLGGTQYDGWVPPPDGPVTFDLGGPDGPRPDGAPTPDAKPKPDSPLPPDTTVPDLPLGQWVQANSKNCATHCPTLGQLNVTSPEGALCMSGENRPASGVAQKITFTYGCYPNCAAATGAVNSSSSGVFCYRPGQKQDSDGTDRTVGCFCT